MPDSPRRPIPPSLGESHSSLTPHTQQVSASSMRTLVALRDALTDSDNLAEKLSTRVELLSNMINQGSDPESVKQVLNELSRHASGMSGNIQKAIEIANGEFERRMRLEAKLTLLEDSTVAIDQARTPGLARTRTASAPPSDDSGSHDSDGDQDDDYESDSEGSFYDADENMAEDNDFENTRASLYQDASAMPSGLESPHGSMTNLDENVHNFPSSVIPARDNRTLDDYHEYDGYGVIAWRDRLPCDKPSKKENNGPSLWDMLKNAIGKDLSRITLPAIYMMPLSVLQRWAEELEYRYLVEKAIAEEDPMERLLWVTAFAMSAYGSTINEEQKPVQGKPFNPLLGETFEWDRQKDWGLRFFAEQVSHHPPITAFHCVHKDWIWHGDCNLKNKFWGNSVEVFPTGKIHLHLRKWGEHYSWSKVTTCVHSLMSKEPYPDHYGWLEVRCHQTNRVCRLKLVKKGFFGGGRFEMHGAAYTPEGDHVFTLGGKWSEALWVREAVPEDNPKKKKKSALKDVDLPPTRELWRQKPRPPWAEKMYRMTEHSMSINEPHPDVLKWCAPTDARKRPDERAMENGDMRLCTSEKIRLEEKQRAARKRREKAGGTWTPRWFEKRFDPESQSEGWTYTGKYWDCRAQQDWSACPDIW
eukprot:TRINITY_DN15580_c0_g1_i1.p1 TRINITY_DN15580_c0_g1~~TRINITY_DN15580_c0_g1_i1.p1  ORF type:complete len:644 (-),score=147.12 TRINITY_DN15580_c0_g1_i1:128-2059(-)